MLFDWAEAHSIWWPGHNHLIWSFFLVTVIGCQVSWVFHWPSTANYTSIVVAIYTNLHLLILLTFKGVPNVLDNPTFAERVLALLATLGLLADLVPWVALGLVQTLHDQSQTHVLLAIIVHHELVLQVGHLVVDGWLSDDNSFIIVHFFLFNLLLLFDYFRMASFFFVNDGQLAIATLMAFTTLFSLLYFFKFMIICCRFLVCCNQFILIYHHYLLPTTFL